MGLFESDPLLILPFAIAGAVIWDCVKLAARRVRSSRQA